MTAWSDATRPPTTIATMTPSHGLPVPRDVREPGYRAHQHHAFDAEIQDTGSLGKDLADGGEEQDRPDRDPCREDERQVHQPGPPAARRGSRGSRTRRSTNAVSDERVGDDHENRMIPWIIAGTPDGWISRPARIRAPNRIAATTTLPGWNFAR